MTSARSLRGPKTGLYECIHEVSMKEPRIEGPPFYTLHTKSYAGENAAHFFAGILGIWQHSHLLEKRSIFPRKYTLKI